ncbi:M23 family metallopeptidase [Bacillus sp. ISL-77]|uniref:M23 family metallopeptidase n=1 Tax=Bacillus sp. ISL-77 TaxID=2819138 RepID=UPI001BE5E159|nr:M23 family metallopeptidase [Bacillus sp. ISL-77]MBT2741205.1 M23 family metallopeptidase [Bacillus sp. ISL-77]
MKFRLSSEYGELSEVRNMVPHPGIDFAMPEGTELRSVMNGVVERVVDFGNNNLGKGVFIRNDDGTLSIYGHMSKIKVKAGEHLTSGESIGFSGNSGHSTAAHLHYGMKDVAGHWMDPTPVAENVSNMSGNDFHFGDIGGVLLDKYNKFADKVIGAEMNMVVKPAQETLQDWLMSLGHTLTDLMPEIGTGITILAGIAIMFTGNFPKYITRWGFAMMGVISWILLAK